MKLQVCRSVLMVVEVGLRAPVVPSRLLSRAGIGVKKT